MPNIGNLSWDATGEHYYYTGIDGVALFVWDDSADTGTVGSGGTARGWYRCAAAWDGVTAVNESPSGAESNKVYADNIEYLNLISKEEFGLTLECYQTPEAFDECDGSASLGILGLKVHAQSRKKFGLIYRVLKGSDTEEAGKTGYVYHVVYGCKAAPSSRDNATVNESPEAQTLSYEISTSPITDALVTQGSTGTIFGDFATAGVKELVHIEIDTTGFTSGQLSALAAVLYPSATPVVSEAANARIMPTPAAILAAVPTVSNG